MASLMGKSSGSRGVMPSGAKPAPAKAPVGGLATGGGFSVPAPTSGSIPGAPAPAQVPKLTNTTTPDPGIAAANAAYQQRMAELKAKQGADPNAQFLIDQYKKRLGTDNTDQLIDRSTLSIADAAEAQKAALQNRAGRAGSGFGAQDLAQVDSDAARRAAGSADNIRLGREAQMDSLVMGGQGIMGMPFQQQLAQDQMMNQMTGLGLGYAQAGANNNLAQQGLGLQQWQAQNQFNLGAAGLQQQAALANQQMQQGQWNMLMKMAGY